MIKVSLKNPSDKDIIDYKISEAKLDADGNALFDPASGGYKETGMTLKWTLKAGETKIFPKYVADYLKGIYDFLKIEESVVEENVPETTEAKPVEGMVSCKFCGMNFKNMRALGLHMGSRHSDEIL
jgi:hypothetical protein